MTQPSYSRRNVVISAVVAAGAGVAGFVAANNSRYAKAKQITTAANNTGYNVRTPRKQLAAVSKIPVDGGLIISDAGVVLVRDEAGSVRAFSSTCTHQGCTVTDVRNGQIICPCHGSTFSVRSGNVTGGPARRPLPQVPVTVEGDAVFTEAGG